MRAVLLGTVCILALTQGALADAMLTESVVVSGRATDLTGIAVSSNEGSISAGDMVAGSQVKRGPAAKVTPRLAPTSAKSA